VVRRLSVQRLKIDSRKQFFQKKSESSIKTRRLALTKAKLSRRETKHYRPFSCYIDRTVEKVEGTGRRKEEERRGDSGS
jgi:hypothetical protein